MEIINFLINRGLSIIALTWEWLSELELEYFINKWQTLIGGALGPFLLGIGFWLKNFLQNRKDYKEYLRRVEISITRSLDDTVKTRQKLQDFISRVRNLANEIEAIQDETHFSIDTEAYPIIKEVFRDIDMPNFPIKSYYLHNKLIWTDQNIKEINEVVTNHKSNFSDLLRKNELQIILIRQSNQPNAKLQRKDYVYNLRGFANSIEKFINFFINEVIRIMIQVKIYNEKLRTKHGFYWRWKNEGTRFKYFRNKKLQKDFSWNFDSIGRIDKTISSEVASKIKEGEDRMDERSS